jgi:phage gpG-like protein
MNMVEMKIDDRECLRVLDKIARKGRDASSLMADAEGDMLDAVEENFKQQGRPGKWAALRPSTRRARAKKGKWPGMILQVKGILAKSVQGKHDSHSATVGTNDKRAKMLHFGGTVNHAARDRVLHFAKDTRFKKGFRGPMPQNAKRKDLFAKPGKASYGMKVQGKAYSVKIIGRPFMVMMPSDIEKIKRHAKAFLQDL